MSRVARRILLARQYEERLNTLQSKLDEFKKSGDDRKVDTISNAMANNVRMILDEGFTIHYYERWLVE